MPRFRCLLLCLIITTVLLPGNLPAPAHAKGPKYLFKIASLAPDGSVWATRFREFAQEVTEKSNGEIDFKIYAGGVMGDDRAMYRKMRIGQLHGGGFTMTGLGEVVPDFRVLGIPFLFNSYEEVDSVVAGIWKPLKKSFADKGLALVALSEVGFIYAMSTEPLVSLDDLKKSKSWIPEGDPVSEIFMRNVGVTPTPLSIPDVLTSLQTGLIDTVFNSFYGSIVLQWFTRTKYITDYPFAYSYGAVVLDGKKFSRLPPAYAAMLEKAAAKHFTSLLADTRKSNAESLDILENNGIKLVKASPEARAEMQKASDASMPKLIGSAFSKEIYEATIQRLADHRAKHPQKSGSSQHHPR